MCFVLYKRNRLTMINILHASDTDYGPVVTNGNSISVVICNGNRTEWSPIRSVIIRVITKSDDRAAGV